MAIVNTPGSQFVGWGWSGEGALHAMFQLPDGSWWSRCGMLKGRRPVEQGLPVKPFPFSSCYKCRFGLSKDERIGRVTATSPWQPRECADQVLRLLEQEAISRAKALELLEEIARTGKRPVTAPWGELNWGDDCPKETCASCGGIAYLCSLSCPDKSKRAGTHKGGRFGGGVALCSIECVDEHFGRQRDHEPGQG